MNMLKFMRDDVVQDGKAHVERVVSAKMGELEVRLSMLLSRCANEASVRDEAAALKELLAGVETRFREEHTALVDAINAHTKATTAQTALLGALCCEVKTTSEKVDALCSHTRVVCTSRGTLRQSTTPSKLWRRQTLFHPSSRV